MLTHSSRAHMTSGASRGFTLIEVLLVLTITGILTVSGFRAIIDIQRSSRVNDAHATFLNYLDLARSYSLNGKVVNNAQCENTVSCVPKLFGVTQINATNDPTCQSGKKVIQFYSLTDLVSSNDLANNVLDSFCLNSRVTLAYSENNGTPKSLEQLTYIAPFGEFRTPSVTSKTAVPLKVEFCDGSSGNPSCSGSSLIKPITLYSNVGVPE